MRPKDENQHGSMRPNLMSSTSRRASSEENILAMLERDTARRGSSARMAWYGAGSALAVVMVGALLWLAYDNTSLHEERLLTPVAVAASVPAAAPRPAPVQPAHAATIVEAPPEPITRLAVAEAPVPDAPPLVLLTEGEAVQKVAARVAAPARKALPAPANKRAQAKGERAKPRPAHASAAARARKAKPVDTRAARIAPPASAAGEAPADSDVALISAILGRSAAHAAERGQEARP